MDAPLDQQRTLLELQAHDSAIDRLNHQRGSLPEHARLEQLATNLAAIDQLVAERQGDLATVSREQTRLEDEVEMVRRKAQTEEARAISGRVTSPKELTSIQEEVASLQRRQASLSRREGATADQAGVAKTRDAALADIDRELEVRRSARKLLEPKVSAELLKLYEQIRARQGGVGAGALVGNTCQGCRTALSRVDVNALRALPPERIKRCEHCRRILVVE